MKTIQEIKKDKQEAYNNLFTACKVFWAFSDEQFAQNKTPLAEGEKYISIGAGGYMPKSQRAALEAGMKQIEKDYKEAVKANKQRKENILFELRNYECFYVGDIDDAMPALGSDYTREEVQQVFNESRKKEVAA